jgi:uncharacterized protein YbbC (DUF1343 family)/CubicO group peptidase (beta-lactamase class C family)
MRLIIVGLSCGLALLLAGCRSDDAPPAPRPAGYVTPLPPPPLLPEKSPPGRLDAPKPAVAIAPSKPVAYAFDAAKLRGIDTAIDTAIAEKKLPGGVLWLEKDGSTHFKAYGNRAVTPAEELMTVDTIFDAASLTKVMACTPAVMLLVERGQLKLDDPVVQYIPEFAPHGKEAITLRQLLTHTSGLRPDVSLKPDWSGYDAAIALACAEKLVAKPDEKFIYSDTGPILLGEIVRRVTGQMLDQFLEREVYGPLQMSDTGFNPPKAKLHRIAPTEVENGVPVRGVVHDPRARRMGGVAGHAGLFTTAADTARYARMMLNGGELDGVRVFQPATVKLMTSVQTPSHITAHRGLGWDMNSGYASQRGTIFPQGGYGHTGWTGTSLWIDPSSRTFVILLSNRNHPTEKGSVVALRRVVGTLAAEAVGLLPASSRQSDSISRTAGETPAARSTVLNGIDVLKLEQFKSVKGLRLGLITNHTGHDRERNPIIDLLHQAPGVQLRALFSPEHGIRGERDDMKIGDSVDEKTGLPVYSLYEGTRRKPKPEHLRDLDAFVFDIQDIGCRFYTYVGTMLNCMEAASEAGLKFIVLDRINPINGVQMDGPTLEAKTSFVAWHPVVIRHGMTVGELARMFHAEKKLELHLTIVPCAGWKRAQWFDACNLPWTNPSPNMRSLTQATLYPGVGLLETTKLSVGRGTATPFEVVGAPYIDGEKLAAELNKERLPGVEFKPIRYTPDASVFKDEACGGVNILLTDRGQLRACEVGILIALTLQRLYPDDWNLDRFDRLLGHPPTIEAIRAGKSLAEIRAMWAPDVQAFAERRKPFLIYD